MDAFFKYLIRLLLLLNLVAVIVVIGVAFSKWRAINKKTQDCLII
jgi:hypothetical protein